MEKLFHILPSLVGKEVLVEDSNASGVIETFTEVRYGHVLMASGEKRRLSVPDTVRAYFAALSNTKQPGTPEEIKRMAVGLLERMQRHKNALIEANQAMQSLKRRCESLN